MSTAHRPTWDPAQARDVKGGSRQFSVRDMAAHTKLKFRQPGQTSTSDVKKRDLRAELLAAEADARAKKRKAAGLPAEEPSANGGLLTNGDGDEESNKRRRVLEEAMELDRDADSDEEKESGDGDEDGSESGKGKGKAKADSDADDDEDDEEDSDEEDDTAELLRELEKIKRERAEEKARLEAAEGAVAAAARDEEIATANPLLNLAAALGQGPGVSTTAPGTFAVKRRWDDDLIFKNQAMGSRDKESRQPQFVNDLLRTEFHKKFMSRFIK
ncbi:Cwf15/Cwc15 cell cycle control protein [Dentipellis sp. KUC8613]|nr:Cwf15/Cwc15 cell cycle control protein [Dentipellis sp. KUC8613]